jgi:hypothetical protein
MADFKLPPLLTHAPEADPPRQWRVLLLPACLAILGMLIAWAAVTTGQDDRRARDWAQLNYNHIYWDAELNRAKVEGAPPEKIAELEAIAAKHPWPKNVISYARYGRQFTSWDGYRYEEIVEQGYTYHQPNAPPREKDSSLMQPASQGGEPRQKNVVWYPLYPVLGWIVSKTLQLPAVHALTVVSWTCTLLAAVVMFRFAQRHYYNRMPSLDIETEEAMALENHPARRWDLSPQDTAALIAVAAVLFGPCSVFLYANFTESVFLLLLSMFMTCIQLRWWWRAALVAAIASSCRSQGVLFGPILALCYLLRTDDPSAARKLGTATVLGFISAIGLMCYMVFLYSKFGDPLAFMHAQKYWNVGINMERLGYALNPINAMTRVMYYAFYSGPVDWPRLWEALCLIWPPVVLLILGGRYLSFELEIMGWILWGLPYISNSLAGNPPMDTQWMSMGRFMAVMLPAHIIVGAVLVRLRWLAVAFLVLGASAFAVFCVKFGNGAWVG